GLTLELHRCVHHDHHRNLTDIFFDDRSDGVPRFPDVSARTLRLQSDHPTILHHRLRNHHILLDLPLLLILHQPRRDKRSDSIPDRLTLSESLRCTQIRLRLLNNQRKQGLKLDNDEDAVSLLPHQVEVSNNPIDRVESPRRLNQILQIHNLRRISARRDPSNILLELRIPNIQQVINLTDNTSRIHIDRRDQKLLHQHVDLWTRISQRLTDLLHRLQS